MCDRGSRSHLDTAQDLAERDASRVFEGLGRIAGGGACPGVTLGWKEHAQRGAFEELKIRSADAAAACHELVRGLIS